MLTLYARKEKTTDDASIRGSLGHRLDTVVYKDKGCTETKARFPWFHSHCPRRGQRAVMLNCWRWGLVWVN